MSTYTDELNEEIGPCPVCGKKEWWFNDIPLKASCWGSEENEHEEVMILINEK